MIQLIKLYVIYKIFLGPENMIDTFGKVNTCISLLFFAYLKALNNESEVIKELTGNENSNHIQFSTVTSAHFLRGLGYHTHLAGVPNEFYNTLRSVLCPTAENRTVTFYRLY